jgi:hypothetical protein
MSARRRVSAKAFKSARHGAERSPKNLAREFLADINQSWEQHGRGILDRLSLQNPKTYFVAMLKLTKIQQRRVDDCPGFDRRHYRADVLARLEQQHNETHNGSHTSRLVQSGKL